MRRLAFIVIFMFAGIFSLMAQDIDVNDILLYAPFDRYCDALIARGRKEAIVKGSAEFKEGKIGKALLVGSRKAYVGFDLINNLNFDKGSIAFWVAPLDWDYKTDVNHSFIHAKDKEEFQVYYYFPAKAIFVKLGFLESKRIIKEREPSGDGWEKEQWRHIVINWDESAISLYCDGYLKGVEKDVHFPRTIGTILFIGKFPELIKDDFTYRNDTLIDELYILKRPLSVTEMRSIMARGEKKKK